MSAAEIEAVIEAIFEGFKRQDVAAMESCMTQDCTVWDVFQPQLVCGKQERAAYHKVDIGQSVRRGKLTIDIDRPLVRSFGDFAIACYYLHFTYEPPNAIKGDVRITNVFRRIDGRWQIEHHHEGMVPAGIPPLA